MVKKIKKNKKIYFLIFFLFSNPYHWKVTLCPNSCTPLDYKTYFQVNALCDPSTGAILQRLVQDKYRSLPCTIMWSDKLTLPNQTSQTKPTYPNLPNKTYQTKPNLTNLTLQLNIPNQTQTTVSNKTYQTKPTKSDITYQNKDAFYR